MELSIPSLLRARAPFGSVADSLGVIIPSVKGLKESRDGHGRGVAPLPRYLVRRRAARAGGREGGGSRVRIVRAPIGQPLGVTEGNGSCGR